MPSKQKSGLYRTCVCKKFLTLQFQVDNDAIGGHNMNVR